MKNIQQYFKDYPNSQKVFETSDGFLFHDEGDANLHAKTLGDKSVKCYLSSDYMKQIKEGDAAATAAAINARSGKKTVNEEAMKEGDDEEAVTMAAEAEMQNATLGDVVEIPEKTPRKTAAKKSTTKK